MKYVKIYFALCLTLFISCSGDDSDGLNTLQNETIVNFSGSDVWLIDQNLVIDGGPGKDGIPALINPETIPVDQITYLRDKDLVIGITNGTTQMAIPHKILNWHEIVNLDNFGALIAVIYCPLTGTGIGWNTRINEKITTFGVSGLLYKNNIIPYDRTTKSQWSQLSGQCVNGELLGSTPETLVLIEMSWGLWKQLYPSSKVVSTNTGHNRQYGINPYGTYPIDDGAFLYPIEPLINNIPAKERVYVINSGNKAKVYQFKNFENGKVIKDQFDGKHYVLIGNSEFIVSFELDENTINTDFTYSFNGDEIIMTDDLNNEWNIFGQALSGPSKTQFLKTSHSAMMGYYFSVESFFPNPEFYN